MKRHGKLLSIASAIVTTALCTGAFAADMAPPEMKYNLFGSEYYAQAQTPGFVTGGLGSTNASFTQASLLGINATAKFDENWSVDTEAIALGKTYTYQSNALFNSRAFLEYKWDDHVSARIGRQRFPFWMASEGIYNHQALPFREMPGAVYNSAPTATFDGATVKYATDETVLGKFNFSVFGGTPVIDGAQTTGLTFGITNLIGATAMLQGDGWRVRLQYSNDASSMTVAAANGAGLPAALAGTYTGHITAYSAGYRYDKNNIVSWGEYGTFRSPDGTAIPAFGIVNFLQYARAGYVLIGYRFGAFMPRYTYDQADENLGLLGAYKLYEQTFGFNYDCSKRVTFKMDYTMSRVPTASQTNTSAGVVIPAGSSSLNGNAIYAGFDFSI